MTVNEWANDFRSFVNELQMPRDDYKGIMGYIDDAVDLLKEQVEQIKNRDESLEKAREEIKWLRGMLKEQEDIGTELTNAMELIHKKNERIKKLEEQIETLTRWRANAGAFD